MEATLNLKFAKNVCDRLSNDASIPSKILSSVHVEIVANN